MHALKDDPAVDALEVKNALVAQHVRPVNARKRHDVALELHRVEGLFGVVDKGMNVVVVMMVMMIVHKEVGIHIKHIIHVEARDVENNIDRAVAHVDAADGCAGIHAAKTGFKGLEFLRGHEIAL